MTGGRAALLVEFLSCLLLMCTYTVRSPKVYLAKHLPCKRHCIGS